MLTPTIPAGPAAPPALPALMRALEADPLASVVLRATSDPMLFIDAERKVAAANLQLAELLGKPLAEMLGRRPGELLGCVRAVPPQRCGATQFCRHCGANRAIRRAVDEGVPALEECRVLTDGPQGPGALDLEVRTTPFEYQGASYTAFAVRDVSAAKRRAVFERIFFHDVLNALGAVKGLFEVWSDLNADEQKEMSVEARRQMEGLVEEVEAHRELAAAERGDLAPHAEDFDGVELARQVCDLYRHHPAAHGRRVEVVAASGPPGLRSDRVLLGRVLGNLVKNALEATDEGHGVEVSFLGGEAPVFRVRNDTVMPEAVQRQVFQRSFSTKGESGRGLGTFSARLLVEKYLRGAISFRSEAGFGTAFEVRLPAALPDPDPPEAE
ncbi:MAG: PAS domain-containing sensor histidine kinase [Planctomycetes bacterium]|nr:PAS domain-containing sensor histidine kinase [Planctomycetota bacterium]